jgi:hypothetical protein
MLAIRRSSLRRCSSLRQASALAVCAAGCTLALAACSAPPGAQGDDGPTVPPFTGPNSSLPAGNAQGAANNGTTNNGTNGTASGSTASGSNAAPTGEGTPNGAPLTSSGMMSAGASSTAGGSAGAGGAPSAGSPMAPGNTGMAGSASMPPQMGAAGSSMQPPPVQPPPVDVPPGDGSCNGALFCEDFEDYAVGGLPAGAPWSNETGGGATLSIDGTNTRGSRSLHVRTADGGHGYIRVNNFSAPGNSFFGRVQLLVNSFPTSPDYAHFVLVEATGAGGGLVRPVGGQYIPGQGATALWGVGNDQGGSGDWTSWQPTVPTASSRWVCYEWQMRAADNNIDVWLDGTAQPALSVSSTTRRDYNGARFTFPTFNTIWFGWWQFQASSTVRDIYLDDLALSTSRIGCGN